MMRILHKVAQWTPVAVLLVLSLGLVSCGKDPAGGKKDTLVIKASRTSIGSEKTDVSVSITAVGDWVVHVEYPADTDPWLTLNPDTPESGSVTGIVMYAAAANPSETSRKARIVVTAAAGSASVEITQAGIGGGIPSGEAGKWLELPETPEGTGFLFGVHDMDGNPYVSNAQSGTRNWSCWWSPTERVSQWVAYPLNSSLLKNNLDKNKYPEGRTDYWTIGPDPCFSSENQPNTGNTIYGYSRGHQIPSADRRLSEKNNFSTFYPTNMTPQDYNFNGQIWSNLESKIRSYASKCDTLYVVTGSDLRNAPGKASGMTIPTGYWKAVIARKSSSAQGFFGSSGAGFYAGCAFYIEHAGSLAYGNYMDYIMSVDALEAKIGIDLFVNLPDKIGADKAAVIESAVPDSFWK